MNRIWIPDQVGNDWQNGVYHYMKNKPKILLVDDMIENIIALEKLFSELDVECVRATSGNEALKKTLENDFALVLMDVQMPDMDGYETAELIRQERKTRHLTIIFISAIYSEDYYQIKGIETGAADFITKPFNPKILIGKIQVHLDLYKHKASLQRARDNLELLVRERTAELTKTNEQLRDEIAERRQAEETLNLQSEMMKNMTEGIYLVGLDDGIIIFASQRFEEMFGYAPGEMDGKHVSLVNAPTEKSPGETTRKIMGVLNEKGAWYGEIKNIKKDGTPFWCHANVTLFDHPKYGKVLVSVHTDITEQKRVAQELEKHSDHLEELVETRTNELNEKAGYLERSEASLRFLMADVNQSRVELERANKKLQELDRLKTMFIASMSHELRTPLNSIIGFTGIILKGMAGEINNEQRDQLQRVYASAQHLLALISDIIDISRVEAGKIDPYPEEFHLEEIIKEAALVMKVKMDEKGLGLKVDIPRELKLKTDSRRLMQCVLNYISNAVKFTEQGGVTVEARLIASDKLQDASGKEEKANKDLQLRKDWVEIAVTDTGVGIPEEDIPKLFQSFYRLDSHENSTVPGTGLGLYLTKKLTADVLQGTVAVESRSGEGSTFMLRIPVSI